MTLTSARPPGSVGAAPDTGSAKRRRWPVRCLVGLNIVLAVCLLSTGVGYGYLRWRIGQIQTVTIGRDKNGNSVLAPEPKAGDPFNVLLVGSDTRELDAADQKLYGGTAGPKGTAGARSDTIMILHVNPKTETAAILSIPRDLCIDGACHTSERINAAFNDSAGGATTLIQTINNVFGIPINHYAEVNFPGFTSIVNAIGGVTVYFAAPARDANTGLNVANAGCITLDGTMALQYVRSRHYQYFESGKWRDDPTSDFGRIARQQDFIRRVMRKAISTGVVTNPVSLNSLIAAGVKSLTIDNGLTVDDMKTLARRFKSLTPDKVATMTVPTTDVTVGGAAVLKIKQPDTNAVLAAFGAGPVPGSETGATAGGGGASPATVSVRIQNGTGIDNQGTQARMELGRLGFNVPTTGDANSFGYKHTSIRYGRGQLTKAKLLQTYLPNGALLVSDSTVKGADVELVLGADYQGIRAPATAGSPATTSSSAPPAVPNAGVQPKGTDPSVSC